ncbi:MAG: hypothetical protein ACYC96_11285 [Fimbriimonadaceae bacterium]
MVAGKLVRFVLALIATAKCITGAYGSHAQGSHPSAPASLSAAGAYAAAEPNWPTCAGAMSYTVLREDPGSGQFLTVYTADASTFGSTTCSYLDLTLNYGQTYQYEVTAANSYGASAPSPVASATTNSAPQFLIVAVAGNGSVTLSWPGHPSLTHLDIERGPSAIGPWCKVGQLYPSGSVVSYTDATAVNGTLYFYRILEGSSGWLSNVISATPHFTSVPISIVPNPPPGFLASGGLAGF